MKVVIKINHYTIKILIDDLIHVFMWREEFVGFQSWSDGNGKYAIEFYTKTNSFKTEQDTKEKWVAMLKELNDNF